jgi:hypothetical protein
LVPPCLFIYATTVALSHLISRFSPWISSWNSIKAFHTALISSQLIWWLINSCRYNLQPPMSSFPFFTTVGTHGFMHRYSSIWPFTYAPYPNRRTNSLFRLKTAPRYVIICEGTKWHLSKLIINPISTRSCIVWFQSFKPSMWGSGGPP